MTDILDRLSELPVTELRKLRPAELTTKEAVVRALLLRAYSQAKGHRDRVLMFDRLDGKAHQSVQIIGEGNDLWRELGEEWDDVLKRGMSNAELVAMLDQLDDTPPVDGRGMVGGEA